MKEEFIAAEVTEVHRPFYRHVSWSAIAAGLAVAMVVQIILTMLGVSIGAATVQPLEERNPVEGLGVGAGIWWFVTGLISLFVGAFVAGRLAGVFRRKDGALHGFLMWSTATVVAFVIAGMAGGFFGTGAMSAMGEPSTRHKVMNEVDEKTDEMSTNEERHADYSEYDQANRADTRTSPATPYSGMSQANPTEYDTSAAGTVDRDANRAGGNVNLLEGEKVGQATGDADDNDRVAVGSQEEAELREAGEKVADTAARAALISLFSLLIGAGVCTWAGARGVPHDYVPPREHDTRVPSGALPTNP